MITTDINVNLIAALKIPLFMCYIRWQAKQIYLHEQTIIGLSPITIYRHESYSTS